MAGTVGLHDLIGSVAGAIVDAQGIVERHYLDLIGRYFDSQGRAISFDIKVPDPASHAAAGDFVQLSVPLLSLVESSLLAIKEMKITLDVELGDIADAPLALAAPGAFGAPRGVPAIGPTSAAAPTAGDAQFTADATMAPPPQPAKALNVGIGGRAEVGGPMARLTIKVEAHPPSEGLLRLLTQLNKVV